MTRSPSSSEISVVVQGPIVGADLDSDTNPLTQRCMASIRRLLPNSELILSTWHGADVKDLVYDRLVLSKDPGPTLSHAPKGQNLNRLIVSTCAGLEQATRPFILKIRTDIELTGTRFLEYFARYAANDATVFSDRIVTWAWFTKSPARSPISCLFHLSDMVHFGRRQDVNALWTVPPFIRSKEDLIADQARFVDANNVALPSSYYAPEQYLCLSWLKKKGPRTLSKRPTPEEREEWERILAANFIVIDPEQFGAKWKDGVRLTKTAWAETYSHAEWQMLYRRHCDPTFPKSLDLKLPIKNLVYLTNRHAGWLVRAYSALYHTLAPNGADQSPLPWRKILKARLRKPPR